MAARLKLIFWFLLRNRSSDAVDPSMRPRVAVRIAPGPIVSCQFLCDLFSVFNALKNKSPIRLGHFSL
jgi:hypothetical protein